MAAPLIEFDFEIISETVIENQAMNALSSLKVNGEDYPYIYKYHPVASIDPNEVMYAETKDTPADCVAHLTTKYNSLNNYAWLTCLCSKNEFK